MEHLSIFPRLGDGLTLPLTRWASDIARAGVGQFLQVFSRFDMAHSPHISVLVGVSAKAAEDQSFLDWATDLIG